MKYLLYISLLCGLLFAGCRSDVVPPEPEHEPTPYTLQVPERFPQPLVPTDNPMTEEGVKLGRMLFYERQLSTNGRSCGSCHIQDKAFILPNSYMGLPPEHYRNIPSLVNLVFNPNYGWIGDHDSLDLVAIGDFGPMFFDISATEVSQRLKAHPEYPELFAKAYPGQDMLTPERVEKSVAYAIAQFIRTIISADSKFDRYLRNEEPLTLAEQRGMQLFFSEKGDCFHCHNSPLFTDNDFHNIGLESSFSGRERGRYSVTGKAGDIGKFGTPTLRNIELTAPYMHDGRFATLEEVIEHYNSGVQHSPTLDPIMTKPGKEYGLQLSAQDKADFKAFLLTLTDRSLLTNPDFKNPHN